MELDLTIDPDDASRFLRLPQFIAALRHRPVAQRIVWHDSADAILTAHGLALAQERSDWRLEKLRPDPTETWPPGAPPPLLAQAATQAELGYELPAPMAPVAAFTGRRHTLATDTEQGRVMVALTRGMLRSVGAEDATARVQLAGDERAVLAAALALDAALPLTVAQATLAGEALAMARATPIPPRRHGAPELPDGLGVADAFAFILAHLADVVMHQAPEAAADTGGPEPVHQMRVALRRLRSAITIFRPVMDSPELQVATSGLKGLGSRLGPTRDWDVLLGETLPAVRAAFPHDPRLARLMAAAGRRRQECHAALCDFLEGPEYRRLGIELAWLAAARCWHPLPAEDAGEPVPLRGFAAEVLDRRRRKLTGTDDLGALEAPERHALRLKAKRARYAAEMFAPLYSGKPPRRFIQRLAAVQEGLGELNDAATAERLLGELGGAGGRHGYASGLVLGFVAANTAELLPQASRRWDRFLRTRAFWD